MSKRFFAFGCSYTKYSFATWADYVGVNFDEYYNYGKGGVSNTYIMNKFIEADAMFNFNSNDCVMVMVTGIGRFSYIPKSTNSELIWKTPGDIYENYMATKDYFTLSFVENMYSEDWSVYSSWIAVKTIKALLDAKKVPHKFLMSIDNSNYLESDGTKWAIKDPIKLTHLTREIYDLLDVKESLDEWMVRQKFTKDDYVHWTAEKNRKDGHPTQKMHYNFISEKFPELITSKSQEFYEEAERIFISTKQHDQGSTFYNQLQFRYDKSQLHRLI